MFDFDAPIDRRGTHCSKWDGMAARTGVTAPDGIAMWVADMDFAAPAPVRERLAAAVAHGVFGYYGDDASWRGAVCGWMARRHGWAVEPDWITPSAGVCAALSIALQASMISRSVSAPTLCAWSRRACGWGKPSSPAPRISASQATSCPERASTMGSRLG